MLQENDLVITADIPLADRTIQKMLIQIDHGGATYTPDNIKQYLAIRNLNARDKRWWRNNKGPAPFSQKDAQQFTKFI